jgi:FMN phosphatase YigB (HAD superfamily)
MSATAPIAAAAVGFDLGETLYHYRRAPFSWLEQARPALERVFVTAGVDRSQADIATAHEGRASYSEYLRPRIERVSAASLMTARLRLLCASRESVSAQTEERDD